MESSDEEIEKRKKKRSRHKKPNPNTWKKNIKKNKRQSGKKYKTVSNKTVKARELKEVCQHLECNENVKLENREKIKEEFRKLDKSAKWDFISRFVEFEPKKTETTSWKSRRESTYTYTFRIDGKKIPVCKKMFLNTLNISDSWIKTVKRKLGAGMVIAPDQRGKNKKKKINPEIIEIIKEHINLFPRVPAHYCRKDSEMQYLDSDLNVRRMYTFYEEWVNPLKPK